MPIWQVGTGKTKSGWGEMYEEKRGGCKNQMRWKREEREEVEEDKDTNRREGEEVKKKKQCLQLYLSSGVWKHTLCTPVALLLNEESLSGIAHTPTLRTHTHTQCKAHMHTPRFTAMSLHNNFGCPVSLRSPPPLTLFNAKNKNPCNLAAATHTHTQIQSLRFFRGPKINKEEAQI